MGHPTELQCVQTMAPPSQSGKRSLVRPHGPPDFRSEAEEMLREMAFVLHVTRSLKQAMIDEKTSSRTRQSLAAVAT